MIIGEKTYHWLHEQVNSLGKILALTLVSLSVFSVLAYLSNASMDLNIVKVPKVWWLYTIPVAGYSMVYGLSWLIVKYGGIINKPLLWLGRNSLLVMCLHEPIKRVVIKIVAVILRDETDILRHSFSIGILMTIMVLMACYPLAVLVNKKMAWMVGKRIRE